VFALSLSPIAACHDGDGVVSPLSASGTYVLESVTGRGPAAGTVLLTPTGQAVRRVRYAQAAAVLSPEWIARGTFSIAGSGVLDLRLREDDGRSTHVWRPSATLVHSVLRIRHPDPADGPDIVESYRRQ
jgi:hypothetical protein